MASSRKPSIMEEKIRAMMNRKPGCAAARATPGLATSPAPAAHMGNGPGVAGGVVPAPASAAKRHACTAAEVQQVLCEPRRSRNAGIHTIEIYSPQFYFSQSEMEEYDAQPERYGPSVIGKYTKGIGQIEGRIPTDDEDPISFAMTVVHRLLERMERDGFNHTGRYTENGEKLAMFDAVGRIDVGTESITDRSKSMKSYIMDIFERHGGSCDVEGVDQYNACYGGQACGLSVLNWMESERWDGRYGIGVATDIAECHHSFIAFAGAATTAALYFPDAPLANHSYRASCILHRFDFFKPVGWHDMHPVTDGKYSVECYLNALDTCHKTLKKKINDAVRRRTPEGVVPEEKTILGVTDYNVFHTGGGYHIVRKAFDRLVRCDRPQSTQDERMALVEERLHPSTHLLKIIGPCHTVSSFLNISSVCMSEMEKMLGKVICVFSYGSGCASTMYQLRVDDLPHFEPLSLWKLRFYRDSIKLNPAQTVIHDAYCKTWMKFDYIPKGRKEHGVPLHLYEQDVYYLMEIDKFGRRFYHRGGLATPPLEDRFRLPVDDAEGRRRREDWGEVALPPAKLNDDGEDETRHRVEYEMTYDGPLEDPDEYEILGAFSDPRKPWQETQLVRGVQAGAADGALVPCQVAPDGSHHSYQIVGSWTEGRLPQEMQLGFDGFSWTLEVVLGENRWEDFHIMQDNNPNRCIFPASKDAPKDSPCLGPLPSRGNRWILDCRDRVDVREEDVGMPGDKYLVTFRWRTHKEVTWERLDGEQGDWEPGRYYVAARLPAWMPLPMTPEAERGAGWHAVDVRIPAGDANAPSVAGAAATTVGLKFRLLRNKDWCQCIWPSAGGIAATMDAPLNGPGFCTTADSDIHEDCWEIRGDVGDVFKISFFRDPEDVEPSAMRMEWRRVEPTKASVTVHAAC